MKNEDSHGEARDVLCRRQSSQRMAKARQNACGGDQAQKLAEEIEENAGKGGAIMILEKRSWVMKGRGSSPKGRGLHGCWREGCVVGCCVQPRGERAARMRRSGSCSEAGTG